MSTGNQIHLTTVKWQPPKPVGLSEVGRWRREGPFAGPPLGRRFLGSQKSPWAAATSHDDHDILPGNDAICFDPAVDALAASVVRRGARPKGSPQVQGPTAFPALRGRRGWVSLSCSPSPPFQKEPIGKIFSVPCSSHCTPRWPPGRASHPSCQGPRASPRSSRGETWASLAGDKMASGRGETTALHLQLQGAAEPSPRPAMKMEDTAVQEMGRGGVSRFLQIGSTREFLSGEASRHVKQEPDELLPSHQWAPPRQEFSPSGWRNSALPKPLTWDNSSFQAPYEAPANPSPWPSGGWGGQTLASLSRGTQTVYSSHEHRERRTYRGLKEEPPNEGTVGVEIRRQRFRRHRYQVAEGPREACRQLEELCHEWLQPERRTKEQILELLILEQFLTILPQEMQSWVRERGPDTCSQAVAFSEEFLVQQRETQRKETQVMWSFEELMLNPTRPPSVQYPAMTQQVHYPTVALPMQYPPLAPQSQYPAIGQPAPHPIVAERMPADTRQRMISRKSMADEGATLRPYGPIQEFRRPLTNAERMRNRRMRNRKQRLETSMQLVESASRAPSMLLDAMRGLHCHDLKAFDRARQEERQHRKQERRQDRATAQLMVDAIKRSHSDLGEFLGRQTSAMAAIAEVFTGQKSPAQSTYPNYSSYSGNPPWGPPEPGAPVPSSHVPGMPSEPVTSPVIPCPVPPVALPGGSGDPVLEPSPTDGPSEAAAPDSPKPSTSDATSRGLDARPSRGTKRKTWD